MMEITRKGVPTQIEGTQPKVGDKIPAFSLPSLAGKTVTNEDLLGKTTIISVFPDINTRTCDLQTRHFFKVASELDDVTIVNLSNNTLDQFGEWCATAGIDAEMLSDADLEFAHAYGLYMPEFNVLARSIFVVDAEGVLKYVEIVPEMANEPNYDAAIAAAK
ncbi:thiol peroxidase [Erysipelothrix sp. HDW6C]|uniref:thiol peroxidase n=1 Tax=Erysipelothrix sp. HDW6C TaxID=2714930 RepID=UPI001F0E0B1B|nr:thiol peroxidase [Erysipelothrix sp. HDW6C]